MFQLYSTALTNQSETFNVSIIKLNYLNCR